MGVRLGGGRVSVPGLSAQGLPVLGAGGWGTALAVNAARNGPVTLWARREAFAAELDRERVNAEYLPGVTLPANLQVTPDLAGAV
ncbi:hypothetical protein IHN59_07130, partial [Deinococcus sp. 23YEL01]|nr:hypothetical protein [Deinococcus sp. 23YEL01]